MTVEFVAETDVGTSRDQNEDSVLATTLPWGTVLAVADGMGGHAAGDVASETALDAFEAHLRETTPTNGDELTDILDTAVTRANEAVLDAADTSDARSMGTTLVAAVVVDDEVTFINVGDSRGYQLTVDAIEQITVDQSLVQELVEAGTITPEEAKEHPQRNVVSQSLGSEDSIEPDFFDCDLDGTLLLCSDGLPEEVDEASIHEIVTEHDDLEDAADALIEQANENGGSDNISVVLGRQW